MRPITPPRNFLQWFVSEQLEEVASREARLSVLRRAGEGGLLTVEANVIWDAPQETLRGIHGAAGT